MCNLLIPLCPFVLHSITSNSAASQNAPSDPSTDAKILFSYLSKSHTSLLACHQIATAPQPKPLSLPSLKLYKRTKLAYLSMFLQPHCCSSSASRTQQTYVWLFSQYCARCSSAARLLRPVRRGGPMDRNTRNDSYWNRCIFLGASGVFEADEEVYEKNGNQAPNQLGLLKLQSRN